MKPQNISAILINFFRKITFSFSDTTIPPPICSPKISHTTPTPILTVSC